MLRKLIKYDMRSISKAALPIFLVSGMISIVCCVSLYFTYGFAENAESVLGAVLATSGFYLLGILAIGILWAVTAFISISRYYKSLFTDEGYLTMVLPVKTSTILNAKLISTFVWIGIATVVTGACAIVALYLPTVLYDSRLISDAASGIKLLLGIEGELSAAERAVMILDSIGNLFSYVSSVFTVITAVTVGAVVLRKKRILGSVLFCFIISFVTETVISIFSVIIGIAFGENNAVAADITGYAVSIVLYVLLCVGMYFVNLIILDKK